MATDSNGQDWQERLTLACTFQAGPDEQDKEQAHFGSEAEQAPLDELRVFLDRPGGKFDHDARAVMREVLRQREARVQTEANRKAQGSTWRWGLAQQIIAGLVLLVAGAFIGAWFSR